MSNTNTGGPAFPINANESADRCIYTGMTLRDYFAAKAMQGKLAMGATGYADVAWSAYQYADAMMKARDEQ